MKTNEVTMPGKKRIALVAHDKKKKDLIEWAKFNSKVLVEHEIWATGTTGTLLEKVLEMRINKLKSGPLGGDQQIGSLIAEDKINLLIFFWDPLTAQPHDSDVKALLRIAVAANIVIACDRATADFVISSHMMHEPYARLVPNYEEYLQRPIPEGEKVRE